MFGLGKKKKNLVFKSNDAALEYSSKYTDCNLRNGLAMPAVVVGLGEYDGGPDRDADNCHVVRVKIPTTDGTIEAVGIASVSNVALELGELVEWVCTTLQGKLIGGVVVGRLAPELAPNGWRVINRFD